MTAKDTPTIRLTGYVASNGALHYTERGHGKNDTSVLHAAGFGADLDRESLDACRGLSAPVREVMRVLLDRGYSYEFGAPTWGIRITTADDCTRVYRTLTIEVTRHGEPVTTIPTGIVFGAGDPTGQMLRGREEEACIRETVEALASVGLPIVHHYRGVWDDAPVVTELTPAR